MINPANDEFDDGSRVGPRIVILSAREIRAAARLLEVLTGVEVNSSRELSNVVGKVDGSGSSLDPRLLVERAYQTFADRAGRSRFFDSAMFGEAAWDMLLALYVSEQSAARHTVSGLLSLSGVPSTTALRWLDFLEREGLVTRQPNPMDRRICYITLAAKGRDALDAYFSATRAGGSM